MPEVALKDLPAFMLNSNDSVDNIQQLVRMLFTSFNTDVSVQLQFGVPVEVRDAFDPSLDQREEDMPKRIEIRRGTVTISSWRSEGSGLRHRQVLATYEGFELVNLTEVTP